MTSRPWIKSVIDPGHLALIERAWLSRLLDCRSALDIELCRFRIACDQLVLEALRRTDRRFLIVNLVNDALLIFWRAAFFSNLLLLVMVFGELAEPWPMMQVMLACSVMLSVVLDMLWVFFLADKVVQQ